MTTDIKTTRPPTPRQLEIRDFVKDKQQTVGPTIREICARFGFRSPNGAMCHLKALEKKGLIRIHKNTVRGIEVLP